MKSCHIEISHNSENITNKKVLLVVFDGMKKNHFVRITFFVRLKIFLILSHLERLHSY